MDIAEGAPLANFIDVLNFKAEEWEEMWQSKNYTLDVWGKFILVENFDLNYLNIVEEHIEHEINLFKNEKEINPEKVAQTWSSIIFVSKYIKFFKISRSIKWSYTSNMKTQKWYWDFELNKWKAKFAEKYKKCIKDTLSLINKKYTNEIKYAENCLKIKKKLNDVVDNTSLNNSFDSEFSEEDILEDIKEDVEKVTNAAKKLSLEVKRKMSKFLEAKEMVEDESNKLKKIEELLNELNEKIDKKNSQIEAIFEDLQKGQNFNKFKRVTKKIVVSIKGEEE